MSDHHLFSVMESLVKIARMRRRKELDYFRSMLDMYDDAEGRQYLSRNAIDVIKMMEHAFDSVSQMNTDAFGTEQIEHYKDIMLEAADRGMREPYEPIYDKEPNDA